MPIVNKKKRSLDAHLSVKPTSFHKTLSDFFDNDYRKFSIYVLQERCAPSIADGFRVGARKALYSAFVGTLKHHGLEKMLTLIGDSMKLSQYQHGEAGLLSSIKSISATFMHNLNPLFVKGQNGSLRVPDNVASPRYLSVKLSDYSFIYEYDSDLWENLIEENMVIEPKFFLPPVCTLLCSQNIGLAPGYKYQLSVPYNPIDVIDAQIEYLKNKKITTKLKPFVRGMNNNNFSYSEKSKRWTTFSEYNLFEKSSTVQVTDLCYGNTFASFENNLNKLLEKGLIRDWKNFSKRGAMDYKIIFEPKDFQRLSRPENKNELEKMLLLTQVIPQNIFNIINEKNKLQYFDDEYALLKHFCDWRLTIYEQRKTKLISVMEERYKKNNEICEFISLVNSGKIKIQNRKKADIKEDLKKFNLSADVLQTEISKLTDEEKALLIKKNEELQKELEYVRNTTILDMFLKDLKDIKKKIKDDF